MESVTKVCSKCNTERPISEFRIRKKSKDGRDWWCKACAEEYMRSWKSKNKPHVREYFRKYARDHYQHDSSRREPSSDVFAKCSKCGTAYPFTNEYFDLRDGPGSLVGRVCKPCGADRDKRKRAEYRIKSWEKIICFSAKRRAKDRGIEFSIVPGDILDMYDRQMGKCYWFGVDLLVTNDNKHPQKVTLDRLDLSKGYTKDNVVLACFSANMGRNSNPVEKFKDFCLLLFGKKNA